MSTSWIVIIAILALALLYVLVPVVVDTFLRYRARRSLVCPETGGKAEVSVDAPRAAWGAAFGRILLKVRDCSLWPERKGCGERCLGPEAEEQAQKHVHR